MENNARVGFWKSRKVRLGFILLLGSVLMSCAHDTGKGEMPEAPEVSEVVVTRENLHSFSSGTGCSPVPYTGLVDGRAFVVAEAFVRMELWTQESLAVPAGDRRRLVDSRIFLYQGNRYADWYPDRNPGGVCPELKASLEDFPKELKGMLEQVQHGAPQSSSCGPAIALMVDSNRVVQSYELVTDCDRR